MYVEQLKIILTLLPLTFRLEISDNALKVNDGKEVQTILDQANLAYHTRLQVLHVCANGDGSNRSRLFVCGFRQVSGMLQAIKKFTFPLPTFNSITNNVQTQKYCARDWAVPDDCVPSRCWRKDNTWRVPTGQSGIIHLARSGYGMGPSHTPHLVSSWDGIAPGPTTFNGNNRRPKLTWPHLRNNRVGPTRVTTPVETPRMASLPHDYRKFIYSFDPSDRFLWLCVHNGIPLRTCYAVDSSILDVAKAWYSLTLDKIPPGITARTNSDNDFIKRCMTNLFCEADRSSVEAFQALGIWHQQYIGKDTVDWRTDSGKFTDKISDKYAFRSQGCPPRSAQVDTGANATLLFTDIEHYMGDCKDSSLSIQVADENTRMQGSKDGTLRILALGPIKPAPQLQPEVTTVPKLHRELFSVDQYYINGFNILLKQPNYEDGIPQMYKPADGSHPAIRIPFRYDYSGGGFWLDYIPMAPSDKSANALSSNVRNDPFRIQMIKAYSADMQYTTSREATDSITWLNPEQATAAAIDAYAFTGVTEIFFSQHAEERTILGVKAGLRKRKQALTKVQFHEDFQHMGSCPGCIICIMVSGAMRRIFKQIDPHVERRRAFIFDMDTITYSHRSSQGNRYETAIKCRGSKTYFSLFLYLRSDMLAEFENWVTNLRKWSCFQGMGYKACSILRLDNAGEWELDYGAWKQMGERLGIEFSYTSADRKEENSRAERAVQIKENKTIAGILQQNLEPTWWQDKSEGTNWLLNRFPIESMSANIPIDGDRSRPLEEFTGGQISRRTIDRQLSYYVAPGTPCLVHDISVKGSDIATKTRWMVAKAMYNEQVIFWCPKTRAEVKTKSYTAFRMRPGVHWTQVCGVDMPAPTKRSLLLSTDMTEKITIQLQEPKMNEGDSPTHHLGPPVKSIKHTAPDVPAPIVTQSTMRAESRGSVEIKDTLGHTLITDDDTGALVSFEQPPYTYSALLLQACAFCRSRLIATINKSNRNLILCIR